MNTTNRTDPSMRKSLDEKLAAIHADPSAARDFIIADAKDADMAFGVGAPGRSPEMHAGEVSFRTLAEYREQIRQIVRQGLVDIVLMSSSTSYELTIRERLFDGSHVTPAARANDTSDIFVVRGGQYAAEPSRPFRSATIDQIQCGAAECRPGERQLGANLGLYSITFNNRLDEDLASLEAYRTFRLEAEKKGFRHFLEVFDPNAPAGLAGAQFGQYINDQIARTLAGVAAPGRPVFLKIVYHGPRALEELVRYDPHLVVGILGGAAGTTLDAFKLIAEAQKYGARVALFGRKINGAENQLAFVHFLRLIVEGQIGPEEAVRAYHGVLERLGIRPHRTLADDLTLQTNIMSYGARSSVSVPAAMGTHGVRGANAGSRSGDCGCGCGGGGGCESALGSKTGEPATCACPAPASNEAPPVARSSKGTDALPDFARMTAAEKLAWNQARRDRIFG